LADGVKRAEIPNFGKIDQYFELVPEGTFRYLPDFLVQNEDNTGRYTNNPDGLPVDPD